MNLAIDITVDIYLAIPSPLYELSHRYSPIDITIDI